MLMSGYEEQLFARAEMLEELGELAAAVAEVLAGAQGAGVDPRAVTSLTAAEAAVAQAAARTRDAERRMAVCEAAADILDPLAERLAGALRQLRAVPQDLGEVYELIYEFVRSGGKLPRYGRWIEGEGAR